MIRTELWTDGSGTTSGPIGWAWILRAIQMETGEVLKEKRGTSSFPEGTNNRAELLAVIDGLVALDQPATVTVFTDSEYVANPMRKGWLSSWQTNGWRTMQKRQGEPAAAACPTCGATGEWGDTCARHEPPAALVIDFDPKMVRNRDLWLALAEAARIHRLTFEHVQGHAGHVLNEECDRLAGEARRALVDQLAAAAPAT